MASGQTYGGLKGKMAQAVADNVGGMTHTIKAMAGGVLPKVTYPGKIKTKRSTKR